LNVGLLRGNYNNNNQALFNFEVGVVKKQQIHNMSVVEMRMLRRANGNIMKDII